MPARTGVCLVRAEIQTGGVLITLRCNPDIRHDSTETVSVESEVEAAVERVRAFLDDFVTKARPG
jgi:hypothetical protein